MGEEIARAEQVQKAYVDCVALRPSSCAFSAGEIHAVCGENGAGKSTLLKITCGIIVPDAGKVTLFGKELAPHTAREAISRGAAMVMQHFALVPVFTALENMMLGAESGAILDRDAARTKADAVAKELGTTIPWDTRVEELGVGDRQRLEIARALYRDAKLLVLDEPTAVLTKVEAAALYATLRRLAEAGKGIVVVTHKMDEVRAHADVITVMRKGEVLSTRRVDRSGDIDAQIADVTRSIMGGEPKTAEKRERSIGDVVLRTKDVSIGRALEGLSIEVRAGEILGVAGVEGNGQRELVQLLAGDLEPDSGSVTGNGTRSVVREDRQTEGLVLDASLEDNILLGELASFGAILDRKAMEKEARARLATTDASSDPFRTARGLSGGNQQKIVIARALAREEKLVVVSQPTRGVDIGAMQAIHQRLRDAAAGGAAVVVVSADLDELRALCDRIAILNRGRIVSEVSPDTSDEVIGKQMLGLS